MQNSNLSIKNWIALTHAWMPLRIRVLHFMKKLKSFSWMLILNGKQKAKQLRKQIRMAPKSDQAVAFSAASLFLNWRGKSSNN